ncbi:FG-GAP-like repeat-containing protein [Haloferula sp.]|uniref:FG-GAP-like repeat-containing protein n=1 Tax=Haloferula sp. TaxID=2497595 RepID=UPI00329EC09E
MIPLIQISAPSLLAFVLFFPVAALTAQSEAPSRAFESPSQGEKAGFDRLAPSDTGVDMTHLIQAHHEMSFLYPTGWACGGVAVGDVNGDEKPDLFITHGPDKNRLFLSRPGKGIGFLGSETDFDPADRWAGGASMVDVNGDGKLDIYVSNYDAPNELWLNTAGEGGTVGFREAAAEFGLNFNGANLMSAFMDFDRDGDLDLFLLNNRFSLPEGFPESPPAKMVDGRPVIQPEWARYFRFRQEGPKKIGLDGYGQPDRLLRNEGGKFADVTPTSGITNIGFGLSALWMDYDDDGWMDLFVANDFTDPDRLYRNLGPDEKGNVRFKNVAAEVLPYTSWSSMGSDIADVDGDGRLDFMVADMSATTHFKSKLNMGEMSGYRRLILETGWPRQAMRNMLYLNDASGRFREGAYLAGVAKTDWTWSVKLSDFDNDGMVDSYVTNGMSRNYANSDHAYVGSEMPGVTEWEFYRNDPPMLERNLVFRNKGNLDFEDVSKAWGLDENGMTYSAATGDLDGDGDLDLVTTNLDGSVAIYRNDHSSGNRIMLRLVGESGNQFGLGATVKIQSKSCGTQVRLMNPMTGFISSNEPVLHFGLGEDEKVEVLEIVWPDGTVQLVNDLAVNQYHTIQKAGAKAGEEESDKPMFVRNEKEIGPNFRHIENEFDDFSREPLLPARLSRFGPGLAWGDANGDGYDDLFIGGAKDQAGELLLSDNSGKLVTRHQGPWKADSGSEDMGVVWIDVDSDSRLDLFVASGGNESDEGSSLLLDRLYLNRSDAAGLRFEKAAAGVIPGQATSSSVVAAADYDLDGDLDLFIGARSVPGKYPETPRSRLLRNDSTSGVVSFHDVTDDVAPEMASAGLVTGAVWADLDGDGQMDLTVATEWGPVRCFIGRNGKFEDGTGGAGLDERLGWWNGVAAGDLNGDGRIDLVVTNAGLNTKYGSPSKKKPEYLYYGAMDGTGSKQLIEAKCGADGILPVRGRSCSSGAMPVLKERFTSYKAFASAKLPDIYGNETLEKALRLEANCLESGVLMNATESGGELRFKWQPLPRTAQISPGFGSLVCDFDGDGSNDIFMVQNLYTREPETGLWRGGLGQLLLGDNSGEFEAVAPGRSGLVVAGDAKGLAMADRDRNGLPDLVVTQNHGRALSFSVSAKERGHALRLEGRPGNPGAVGSRVLATRKSGGRQHAWVSAGSGYLSQSAPVVFLGGTHGDPITQIEVTWPDGKKSEVAPNKEGGLIRVKQP